MTSTIFALIFCTTIPTGASDCSVVISPFKTREQCEEFRQRPYYKSVGLEKFKCMSKSVPVWSEAEEEGGEALKPPGNGYIFRKD